MKGPYERLRYDLKKVWARIAVQAAGLTELKSAYS